MNEKFGADIELIAGRGGVFEVCVDGETVFSKKKLNRFPEEGEVARMVRKP